MFTSKIWFMTYMLGKTICSLQPKLEYVHSSNYIAQLVKVFFKFIYKLQKLHTLKKVL